MGYFKFFEMHTSRSMLIHTVRQQRHHDVEDIQMPEYRSQYIDKAEDD